MFGVSCAPEMNQRVMQQTLQGCKGVQNILDDIIMYGRCKEEHDERLKAVLVRLLESGLTLNRKKCQFNMSQLTFMGHVLSPQRIGLENVKVKAVANARSPKNEAR